MTKLRSRLKCRLSHLSVPGQPGSAFHVLNTCSDNGNDLGTQLSRCVCVCVVGGAAARVGLECGVCRPLGPSGLSTLLLSRHLRFPSWGWGSCPANPILSLPSFPAAPFLAGLTSPFSGGSPFPKVLVTTNTSVSCSRDTTSYPSMHRTCGQGEDHVLGTCAALLWFFLF